MLGGGNSFSQMALVQENVFRGKDIDYSIKIVHRDTFLIDGSIRNKSIATVTQDKMRHDWRGNIVAVRFEELGIDPIFHENMTMEDFRNAVNYFFIYETEIVERPAEGKCERVKISYRGEQAVSGYAKFIAVDIPKDYPVFLIAFYEISKLIDFPVLIKKYKPDKA
jgi:hypothetical protein